MPALELGRGFLCWSEGGWSGKRGKNKRNSNEGLRDDGCAVTLRAHKTQFPRVVYGTGQKGGVHVKDAAENRGCGKLNRRKRHREKGRKTQKNVIRTTVEKKGGGGNTPLDRNEGWDNGAVGAQFTIQSGNRWLKSSQRKLPRGEMAHKFCRVGRKKGKPGPMGGDTSKKFKGTKREAVLKITQSPTLAGSSLLRRA